MKLFAIIILLAMLLTATVYSGNSGLEYLQGLELNHLKVPIYNRNQLQMMVFARSGKRQEQLLIGYDTVIDVLKTDVDVDLIADAWKLRPYPLYPKLADLVNFWQKRINYCEAVLFTSQCNIDQPQGRASGTQPVYLRTPGLDLDGVGFEAEFSKRVIQVISDVKIVARTGNFDLMNKETLNQPLQIVTAKGDSLLADMVHNQLILTGNVKVYEGSNTLSCERLTVFLEDNKKKSTGKQSDGRLPKGISKILADGEVEIIQKPKSDQANAQKATMDHLEYELATGKIIMTGDDEMPKIIQANGDVITGKRITLFRNEQQAIIQGQCRIENAVGEANSTTIRRSITSDRADFNAVSNRGVFTGNVVVTDPKMTLKCPLMRVHLKEKINKSKSATVATAMPEFSSDSGKRELDKVFCENGVIVTGYSGEGKKNNSLSTLTSKRAELNYPGNLLTFFEDVKVRDNESKLDCERLELYLEPRANEKSGEAPIVAGSSGNNKTLRKIIAYDKVHMVDQKSDLTTDRLILTFRDTPENEKTTPGMFQSGGVQLTHIDCIGNVVITNIPDQNATSTSKKMKNNGFFGATSHGKRVLRSERAQSDLLSGKSEFHTKVNLSDELNELRCRDMYVYTTNAHQKLQTQTASNDNPDADPYELNPSENSVPTQIAVTDGMNLQKVICKKEVVITRKAADGDIQQAGGDNAIYQVNDRILTITSTPPNRPWMRSRGRRQFSDVITGNFADEGFHSSGNVVVTAD